MARLAPTGPLPADIRLMNTSASVLGAVGIALVIAALAVLAIQRPVFAVTGIEVVGELGHNSASTIRASVASKLAGNFFTLDLAAARQVFESVPWVRAATVKRVWPNRLQVRLEEYRPQALWAESGSTDEAANRMVDSFGDVFEADEADADEKTLPSLRGPDGSSRQMLAMLTVLKPLFASMSTRIETLELSGRGSWRVELDSGAQIELGRGSDDEVAVRTRLFVATLPEVRSRYQQHPLLYADLRHRDGYALRLEGVTTSVDPVTPVKPVRPTASQKKK